MAELKSTTSNIREISQSWFFVSWDLDLDQQTDGSPTLCTVYSISSIY